MRISDWYSDVCASDLPADQPPSKSWLTVSHDCAVPTCGLELLVMVWVVSRVAWKTARPMRAAELMRSAVIRMPGWNPAKLMYGTVDLLRYRATMAG